MWLTTENGGLLRSSSAAWIAVRKWCDDRCWRPPLSSLSQVSSMLKQVLEQVLERVLERVVAHRSKTTMFTGGGYLQALVIW